MSFIQKILPVLIFTASLAILGFTLFSISEPNNNANAVSQLPPIENTTYNTKGPSDAIITIIEYSDFECPYCAQLQPTLYELQEKYPGQIQIIYRHLPLESIHTSARKAAIAAIAAGKQGKFWEMHDLLFQNQENISPSLILELAKKIELNLEQFSQDSQDPSTALIIDQHISQARSLGITSTPTIYINDAKLVGAQPTAVIEEVIQNQINKIAK